MAADASAGEKPRKMAVKGRSALQHYHAMMIKEAKLRGEPCNPASADFWSRVRTQFNSLFDSDSVYVLCKTLAEQDSARVRHAKASTSNMVP